jgi:hypothetical protein
VTVQAKRVCLINGSLRGSKASSLKFLQEVSNRLRPDLCDITVITVRSNAQAGYPRETLGRMVEADVLVFVFPLYGYGLPGALMRLLEEYHAYVLAGRSCGTESLVYAVVNCAYPRPELTTGEALRVMRNFCRRHSLRWRFGVCIGTGPVVAQTMKVPLLDLKLKRALVALRSDVASGGMEPVPDVFIHPIIPEGVIRRIKEYYEKRGEMLTRSDVLGSS